MSCNWPIDRSCLPELPAESDAGYAAALARREAALALAVSVLWALSGRQFGECPVRVRPCPTPVQSLRIGMSRWRNATAFTELDCGCVGSCSFTGPAAVHLAGPVAGIERVRIKGVELDVDEYIVENSILYRLNGNWPAQDLGRPESLSWSVDYLRGVAVPAGVDVLTGLLAAEFVTACGGNSSKCRLPRNVVSTTRQGVTYQVYDPTTMYSQGKTGLAEVDLWLSSVNPNRLTEGPSVV